MSFSDPVILGIVIGLLVICIGLLLMVTLYQFFETGEAAEWNSWGLPVGARFKVDCRVDGKWAIIYHLKGTETDLPRFRKPQLVRLPRDEACLYSKDFKPGDIVIKCKNGGWEKESFYPPHIDLKI